MTCRIACFLLVLPLCAASTPAGELDVNAVLSETPISPAAVDAEASDPSQ